MHRCTALFSLVQTKNEKKALAPPELTSRFRDFSGQIFVVPGFKNSVQYPSSATILLRPCVPSSDASEPALSTSTGSTLLIKLEN